MNDVAAPNDYLINLISQLKYVPKWMPVAFKNVAREAPEEPDELMDRPFRESLDSIVNIILSDCTDIKA